MLSLLVRAKVIRDAKWPHPVVLSSSKVVSRVVEVVGCQGQSSDVLVGQIGGTWAAYTSVSLVTLLLIF